MPQKIIIASDSFKGSLSSPEVAEYAEAGILRVFPECRVEKIPVADGGEGMVAALASAVGGATVSCEVHDPLMRPISAEYILSEDGKTAVIELAAASGLTLLAEKERNPLITTTFGTGELIQDALRRGCRDFLIGIGGSATNDAGTGMLRTLGFRFLDREGRELGNGGEILDEIHRVDRRGVPAEVREARFTVACDVKNPFSGEHGAAHVFARQKGADDAAVLRLDAGMRHFAEVIRESEGKDIQNVPGAGAAGGTGGGFLAFLNAELKPGVRMVLDALRFEERIRGADLIITGEGRLDRQTGMGKTPLGVLEAAKTQGIPVIAICGALEDGAEAVLNEAGILAVFPIQPGPISLESAMKKENAGRNITRTVEQVMRGLKLSVVSYQIKIC